jgi:hypothetical protein
VKPNPEKLTCLSIVVCDEVYRDEITKKLILVGTLNAIVSNDVPCRIPKLTVMFSLTNGKGNYNVVVTIEHADTGQEIVSLGGPLRVEDPLAVMDMVMPLVNVAFPVEGKYWVVVKADGEILVQRPIWVKVRRARS